MVIACRSIGIQFFSKTKICVDVVEKTHTHMSRKLLESSLRRLRPIHFHFSFFFFLLCAHFLFMYWFSYSFIVFTAVFLDHIQACTDWKAENHPGLISSSELIKSTNIQYDYSPNHLNYMYSICCVQK